MQDNCYITLFGMVLYMGDTDLNPIAHEGLESVCGVGLGCGVCVCVCVCVGGGGGGGGVCWLL